MKKLNEKSKTSSNFIAVFDQIGKAEAVALLLKKALLVSMTELHLTKTDVSLALVNNPTIQKLNRKYRNKNRKK